ncbi:MAG TPA: hypothetical protein VES62_07740 [Thermoleophilaceae bacterium]|nr:hypothetical protein [Thermoleophilaceae bacterium]
MCGEILVILEESAQSTIEEVIEGQGGDPNTDLLYEFQAVRDLLDPDGIPDDQSAATVYGIAVPVGTEEDAAQGYAADPIVYAASVNRQTIGSLTPSSAMRSPEPWRQVLPSVGVVLLVCALVLALQRRSALSRW